MNNGQIASLFRQLADAFDDAAALAPAEPPAAPVSKPRARKPRSVVAPAGVADELTQMRALRLAKKHGFLPTGT